GAALAAAATVAAMATVAEALLARPAAAQTVAAPVVSVVTGGRLGGDVSFPISEAARSNHSSTGA
ncbi:MAG TPA: hypothetical protein VNS52_00405, partial [Gemmatimonadaceae bacterium]|nr:hypothetical protein [Gemmatimonadaceae bacterium]